MPRDIYQFVVLISAKRSGSAFEWADHIAAARAAGLSKEVIENIQAGAKTFIAPFDVVDQLIDCAFAYRSLPSALQDAAITNFGLHGLIEIITLCGYYSLMAMVNGCFNVPLPSRP